MGQWVITVAGVAVLSVLCDIILPEGQTRKYVKTVFGVVVTLIIVLPLVNLVNDRFTFEYDPVTETAVQQQYLDNVDSRQKYNAEKNIVVILRANDIEVSDVQVSKDSVSVRLGGAPSVETEQKVRAVIRAYLPDSKIEITWT